MTRTMGVLRTTVVLMLSATVLKPATLSAGDRPVLFLHGLGAASADWAPTADRLRQRLPIDPRLPSLDWRRTFREQANGLQSNASVSGLGADTVVVGHSNGGIVAREWSKQRQVNAIVTLGTPHQGVPLLSHFNNWLAFNDSTALLIGNVARAFSRWSNSSWLYPHAANVLGWVADFSYWSIVNLAFAIGLGVTTPVTTEMYPGSPYLTALNSGGNLQREASAVPGRVGVVTIAHNYYWAGPVRAFAPEWGDANAAALYGSAAALMFWGTHIMLESQGADPVAVDQGMSLISIANQLLSIDPVYCLLVSSMDMSQCKPSDGLVPYDSQMFPGASTNLIVGVNNDGPAHTQQKQMSEEVLYDVFVNYLHVSPRSAAPPAPPAPGSSGGQAGGPPADSAEILVAGETMRRDQTIHSSNGLFHFIYQGDGNLVLFDRNWRPLWDSGTNNTSPGMVVMQHDGNLVMYDGSGQPIWSSVGSWGHPGAYLVVQNNGNVVIYDVDGSPLWETGTGE
jgi:pimeloyl-ACP methyl ester carboxylesterase